MHFDGILIGIATFFIIGIFHLLVIKGEYYFGASIWPLFAISGVAALAASILLSNVLVRSILGVAGFALLWGIVEVFHQAQRVKKGWYPKNPKRNFR
jgi:hypothetical protein